MLRSRHPVLWSLLAIAFVIAAIVVYGKLNREAPAPFFASDEEHFLYGSIGTEAEQGVPFWIWLVLPRIFPEYLPGPGGYASTGIVSRDGHEMPVGLSKVTIGYPRVAINCAMCHTASYRVRPGDAPVLVPGAPAHQTAPQQYLRFLMLSAADPRFTAGTILDEIAKNTRLSRIDRLLYRFVIIPRTRRALQRLGSADAWMWERPDWGRGRTDALNPVKYTLLKQPIDTTIGHADMPPLWNLMQHGGYALGWDGTNDRLQEVVLSSALGAGATAGWVDRDYAKWSSTKPDDMSSLRRVQNYISGLQPPAYPFPIDRALASAGDAIFRRDCASCHAAGGARTGKVIPAAEVGTDARRLEAWTPASASAYNAYGAGHPWKFSAFRTTGGYVAVPLEGLWLRAPFLHNGSVPSLADLLEKPDRRPGVFRRGYDVYDPARVGFVSAGPEADRVGTLFDAAVAGGGNGGHLYGTDLPAGDKAALIEYLKTL
jgi:processive rubber oxygenase RoxA-like protein